VTSVGRSDRLQDALAAIDAVNAADPTVLSIGGRDEPRALAEGRLVHRWVLRLAPDAGDALQLAARAHHIRRWTSPRSSYPDGRAGYLRWRRDLHEVHAAEVAAVLAPLGYDDGAIARVQALVRKDGLRSGADREVQTLEDAICLTFLDAEFADLADRLDADRMVEILVRTLAKMGPAGKEAAAGIALGPREAELLRRALTG
jgi:hypothetical protein